MKLTEIKDLYSLHSDPSSLKGYADAHEKIPEMAWEKYENDKAELRKREALWASDAEYAFMYAWNVLKGPFPAGEKAIASNAEYAYLYAQKVLKGPFPAGEKAIAMNARYAYYYAEFVLKGPFPAGEKAIATDADYARWYASDVLKLDPKSEKEAQDILKARL